MTGLTLEPAPDMNNRSASHCMSCSMKQIRNVTDKWIRHAKVCQGLNVAQISKLAPKLSAEAQNFVMHVIAGGDTHRSKLCDAYIVAYWVYKYKLPFTTSGKLKEVSLKRYLLSGIKCRLNSRMFRVLLSYCCA